MLRLSASTLRLIPWCLLVLACEGKDGVLTGIQQTETTSEVTTSTTTTGTTTTDTGPTTGPDETTTDTATTTTGPDETTTGSAMSCPDHEGGYACCCFERDPAYDLLNVCATEQPPLCPGVLFTCGPDSSDNCVSANDEAAVDCALAALAGTKPGLLGINFSDGFGWSLALDYAVQGDGTAYLIQSESEGVSTNFEPTGRFTLKPPAFFSDCLTQDLEARGECLRHGVMGGVTEVCLDGFEGNAGG